MSPLKTKTMKRLLVLSATAILYASICFSQAPNFINYQGVARDVAGGILPNTAINLQIKIHNSATAVYTETHLATTNDFGLFNVHIGAGINQSGSISGIDWGVDTYSIEVLKHDGSAYVTMGTSQLVSVPYALYAANSGTAGPTGANSTVPGPAGPTGSAGTNGSAGATGPTGPTGLLASGTAAGNTTYWNGTQWVLNSNNIYNNGAGVGIGTNGAPNPSAKLEIASTNQGLLLPRMTTTQRNGIANPAHSLTIFNTTSNCFEAYNSGLSQWETISCLGCPLPGSITATAATLVGSTSFSANWNASTSATSYSLEMSTSPSMSPLLNSYPVNVGNVLTQNIIGLPCNATYYYRIRGLNGCGNGSYSNIITVSTGACGAAPYCNFTSTCQGSVLYAGETYPVTQINNQCWFAKNLNVGTYITGNQTNNSIIEKWCYGQDVNNCIEYGGLYTWDEAMGYSSSVSVPSVEGPQGVCPIGWHIPSDYEWMCMEMNLGMSLSEAQETGNGRGTTEGGLLKETTTAHWSSPNSGATNSTGFTALPGGGKTPTYGSINNTGSWWTATETTSINAGYRQLNYNNSKIDRYTSTPKTYAYSVRCVKDED